MHFSSTRLDTSTTAACELLTSSEMRSADRFAIASGISGQALMEAAGQAVAACATTMISGPCAKIVVLCGPGNNGGDGFVAAHLLRERGFDVEVGCLVDRGALKGDAAAMAKLWNGLVCPVSELSLAGASLIIDAMFGAGLSRPLDGDAAKVVAGIAQRGGSVPVLAVDVPSGLDANTGSAPLQSDGVSRGAVVEATRTITFFRLKPGHVLLPGRFLCGTIQLADIGIPADALDAIGPLTFRNDPSLWRSRWREPAPDGHKYDRGHAVVVSGQMERTGAARLAARGALRMGAGLVTVASPTDAVAVNAAHLTAIMLTAFDPPEGLARILADERHNAFLIGPGCGVCEATQRMVEMALSSRAAVVLDADAITVLRQAAESLFSLIRSRGSERVVVTPHEGELKRLFPRATGSKLERAREAARMSGAIIVLKGADTVIAAPDGRAAINDNAPATLATAGSGDVLAGFITGMLAQQWPAWDAACAAVWLHGACARAFGPGLIAEDLPEQLPCILKASFPS